VIHTRILQAALWATGAVIVILMISACAPARAGCHINLGQLWCDPDLGRIIPRFRVGITIAPPPAVPAPSTGGGAIVSADYLAEACFSKTPTRNAGCAGFISGVADAHAYQGLYCLPSDRFQMERSVIDYIRRVPLQGLSATNMVLEALRALWPCR
jgi:Rap1a immunity proteins